MGGLLALVALLLIGLFFIRRKRFHNKEKNPVDLLHGDTEDGPSNGRGDLPQFYQPEPFVVPDPTVHSSSHGHGFDEVDSEGRRQSTQTSSDLLRSGTPDPHGLGISSNSSGHTRKSPLGPTQLRPVNIIQHDDGGPEDEEGETIELPPAYTNIRKPAGGASTSATPAEATVPETTETGRAPVSTGAPGGSRSAAT